MMQAQPCIHYDVPGSARKALASAIGEIIGTYPSYQAAPSFAYIIGEYTLDRNGVMTGPRNSQLMLTLDQDGYRTKYNGQPRSRHDAGYGCPSIGLQAIPLLFHHNRGRFGMAGIENGILGQGENLFPDAGQQLLPVSTGVLIVSNAATE